MRENYICVGECLLITVWSVSVLFLSLLRSFGLCSLLILPSGSLILRPGEASGGILVFDIPSKGGNITLSEVLEEHKESITDMASECSGSQVDHS